MKKSARVSEKLVSPGLPGLQVATHLVLHNIYFEIQDGGQVLCTVSKFKAFSVAELKRIQ